ncbi:MAG: DNA polymerase III subunit alpha, partial [Nitrospirae bacterium]|nr:DNA polymerase III subunit alpha [Nitrospirota bacterium]
TDIDPLRYGLLFERFLNPDRVSMPDIDMDFCMDRREEVIHYVTNKFGIDHVAQIITFGTMAAKGVIRDVGRVLDIPYIEVDRVAKLVPNTLNITIDEAIKAEPRLKELIENDQKINELIKIAKNLEGLARHASTHAAGIVISQEPLTEYTPLYKGDKDEIITQYNMKLIEKVGLIKFDFLGLKTLTLIDNAVRLINSKGQGSRVKGQSLEDNIQKDFSIETIPLNDAKTYELLSSGKTFGVFQLESSGMREILIRLKPETFEDIIALVALYRPGPLGSGMVDDFIKRKKGLTAIKYELPELEPILKETYGVILYQEQVMKIANVLSGFSLAEADILRRAMGKKIPEEMEKMKRSFIEGAKKNKVNEKKAEKIFELIEYFAGYGFNKSHSAAYALIAYQTAYLKANYPVEFMASLLTSEIGNTDKIVRYISECKSMGIKILPPDVNESSKQFTIVEEGIRFGLAAVKNVGEAAIEAIISARESSGRFASIFDFSKKVDLRKVNKKVIESLIKCGAFDSANMKRSQLMAVYEKAMEKANKIKKESALNQINIFGSLKTEQDDSSESIPDLPEWDEGLRLKSEKDTLGFYITGHPLAKYEMELQRLGAANTESLAELPDEREVSICGIITGIKNTLTKKGDRMAYLTIEDLHGTVEVIVFPELYKSSNHLFSADAPLFITGSMDKGEKGIKIKATRIATISEANNKQLSKINIKLNSNALSQNELRHLREILLKYRGSCAVYIRMTIPNHSESIIAVDSDIRVNPTNSLINEIEGFLGKDTVTFN